MGTGRRYKRMPVTIGIIAVNVIIFAVLEIIGDTMDGGFMAEHGAMFAPYCLYEGKWYLMVTSMFLHFGFPHLINNMFILFCMGDYLERLLGPVRYSILYLVSGLAGNALSLCMETASGSYAVSAGASGAIFGVVGGMLYIVIRNKGRIETISTKGLLFMLALSLYYGFTSTGVDNMAHIGGVIGGFVMAILLYRKKSTLL